MARIMIAGSQMLQVNITHFESEQHALQWCSEVAKTYVDGEVDKAGCLELKRLKLTLARKRPAASATNITSPCPGADVIEQPPTDAGVREAPQTPLPKKTRKKEDVPKPMIEPPPDSFLEV